MFAKQATLAAALVLAAAGSAFAADASQRNVFDTETNLRAPAAEAKLTREQVRAEFLAARAAGDVNVFDTETVAYVVKPAARGEAKTRLAQSAAPASAK
ncbi:MAG: DUF4148 domain-containing protein [Pseudomonadota bacterium]